jgi:hypothetical protein
MPEEEQSQEVVIIKIGMISITLFTVLSFFIMP